MRGQVDIANSLHRTVTIEFAGSELEMYDLVALIDTGADVNSVDPHLVARLEKRGLVSRFPLKRPFLLGSVDKHAHNRVTHGVKLPIRLGDCLFEETFAIAPMATPPHFLLGLPWIRKHFPNFVQALERYGLPEEYFSAMPLSGSLSLDAPPARVVVPALDTSPPPSRLPSRTQSPLPAPIPLRPSSNPEAAFAAGGVLAALEAEENRRAEAHQKLVSCLSVRAQIDLRLDAMQPKIMAAQINGLTGNDADWLNTIPDFARRFADSVFSDESARELPPLRPDYDCRIDVKDGEKLSTCKLYDMSKEQLEALKAFIDDNLAKGFIRPSTSSASSPCFFVTDRESASRGKEQLRLVIDYRSLNSKIVPNEYPLPLSRTIMERLPRAKIFTKFDVRAGFYNLRIRPGDEWKTAFKTWFGLFEYQVMPMGLATAPAFFQHFINGVLAPYLDLFCFAYLDDIIIFSDSEEEHERHVTLVLEALANAGLHLKPAKCAWSKKEVSFLGFTVVAGKGIRMSDDKIQALRDTPAPRNLSDLRSFLGLVNFYDKFIPHFSDIVAPLTDLTKKDAPFNWSPVHSAAFSRLLESIRNDVFLAAFDWSKPVTLETDASDVAYGGCISQPDENGQLRPIVFFHHKFKDHEKNWDIHDKELYAIVYAFDRYRHFLSGTRTPVSVFSDHRNLAKFMFTTDLLKSHDGRLGRWWSMLAEHNFTIEYRTGSENVVADFLSRYGYDDSAALDTKTLLPTHRFSPKALADITVWFKKSRDQPNIRNLLEKSLQKDGPRKSEKQIGSAVPVPRPATVPAPLVSPRPKRARVVPPAVACRRLYQLVYGYTGTHLDAILPDPRNSRSGSDRRGLGWGGE